VPWGEVKTAQAQNAARQIGNTNRIKTLIEEVRTRIKGSICMMAGGNMPKAINAGQR
jgi:hypothetical protein